MSNVPDRAARDPWPELPLEAWHDTRETLNRWMQVVGKIRLELTPPVNHYWNVPLYLSARGLTTSAIPCGRRWFDMATGTATVSRERADPVGLYADEIFAE